MKLEIAPEVLRDLTAWAFKACPRRPEEPIFSCIRLTAAADGSLTVSATDRFVHHSATGECVPGEPGTAVVPGGYLNAVASSLPHRNVTITGGEEDGRLQLECGAAHFTLPTLPAADHPQMPDVPHKVAEVPGQAFSDALRAVLPTIDPGDPVPSRTGVEIVASGGTLTCASTDNYRIATCVIPLETADAAFTLLIPGTSLAPVANLAAEVPTITVLLDSDPAYGDAPNVAGFTAGNQTMVTRTLQEPFVNWRAYQGKMPAPAHTAIIEASVLAAAIKRCGLAMTRHTEPLELTWRAGHVRLSAGQGEQAARDSVPVEWADGDHPAQEVRQLVNPTYLLDGLDTAQAPVVHVCLRGPSKAVVVIPAPAERLTSTWYSMQPHRAPAQAAAAA